MVHLLLSYLSVCLLLLSMLTNLSGCNSASFSERPNIILIMADDLGWGDVGFNGNSNIKTPSIDQLAAEGIIWDRFYAASAVCSPTRGSVLTGRHPTRLGITHANTGHLHTEEITLAELLRDAGYATGHFGKWHLGTLTTTVRDSNRGQVGDSSHYSIPTMHGFDEYFATEAKVPTYDPMIRPVEFDTLKGESLRYGWAAVEGEIEENASTPYGTRYWTNPDTSEVMHLTGANSKVIMDRVLPFIEKSKNADNPFFAVVWFHTPHLPVVADTQQRERYPTLSHAEQIYYSTITAMDEQIGRLWTYLEDQQMADNTMLWFASDNGPEDRTPGSAGPFRARKRSLYEGGVRIPAFSIWPAGFEGRRRIATPAVTSDYLPTIVEMLDLPYFDVQEIDGVSLSEILMSRQSARNKPIGFQFQQQQSWVDDAWKLISTDAGMTYELYNLISDSAEQMNIYDQHPERAVNMQADLETWIQSIKKAHSSLKTSPKSALPSYRRQ